MVDIRPLIVHCDGMGESSIYEDACDTRFAATLASGRVLYSAALPPPGPYVYKEDRAKQMREPLASPDEDGRDYVGSWTFSDETDDEATWFRIESIPVGDGRGYLVHFETGFDHMWFAALVFEVTDDRLKRQAQFSEGAGDGHLKVWPEGDTIRVRRESPLGDVTEEIWVWRGQGDARRLMQEK